MFHHMFVAANLEGAVPERFSWVMQLARAERARLTILLTVLAARRSYPRSSVTILQRGQALQAALYRDAGDLDVRVRYGFASDGVGLAFAVARDLGCDMVIMGLVDAASVPPERNTLYVPGNAFSASVLATG